MAMNWNDYGGGSLWGPDRSSQIRAYHDAVASSEADRQRQQAEREYQDQAATRRAQFESDREFGLRLDAAKRQKEAIAIQRGQLEAERWYQKQQVKLAKEKLAEDRRQFDMTFGENQRQFNITASGYMDNGRPTLAREQWQGQSLLDWTREAIKLASTPKDWVSLARMYSGVSSNIGNIPGLSWTTGGQVGNQTFAGQPETNSLSNVMGQMGVGSGGGSGDWSLQAAQQAQQIASAPLNLRPDQQQIYQTAREFGMNPAGAAPGWYESLDPLTKDLLQGAAEAQGLDWSTTLSKHRRSRWGGGGPAAAA